MNENYQEKYLHPRITERLDKERDSRKCILRGTQLVKEGETTGGALGGSM